MSREVESRYLPLFASYRPLTNVFGDGDDETGKYIGLSAPFPIASQQGLAEALVNANLADLKIVFLGFYDPLGRFDSEKNIYTGGFQNATRILPVDNAESFGGYLRAVASRRKFNLLFSMKIRKAVKKMWTNMPDFKPCRSGSPKKDTFVRVENHLEKTGEVDQYAFIQSFAEQTDYTTMLDKMAKGDPVATARATAALSGDTPLQYGVENRTDLRGFFSSIMESKSVYDALGGQNKLGVTFADFLRGEIEFGSENPSPASDLADSPKEGAAE